jgi:hypothetical protein
MHSRLAVRARVVAVALAVIALAVPAGALAERPATRPEFSTIKHLLAVSEGSLHIQLDWVKVARSHWHTSQGHGRHSGRAARAGDLRCRPRGFGPRPPSVVQNSR